MVLMHSRSTSTALFRIPPPEEAALAAHRAELATLRETLEHHEQSLAQLRDHLHSFEGRYIRQVGVLYVQLDDWEEKTAELLASRDPAAAPEPLTRDQTLAAADEAEFAQQQAEAAEETARNAALERALALKRLFREVAKRLHPDFSANANDEHRRTHLMAQANEAFHRADFAHLERMLHGYDLSTQWTHRIDLAAELARVLGEITLVRAAITAAQREHQTLSDSEMAHLNRLTLEAAAAGRDHLAEMAARVRGALGAAMRRFEYESSPNRRPAPVIDPESLLSAEILAPRKRF